MPATPPIRALGLGAGGHAAVVIEALLAVGEVELVGLLDPRPELWGTDVLGVPVLGGDDLLGQHYDAGVSHAFIGVGGVGDTRPRRRLYDAARSSGFKLLATVHPRAVVAPSARVGAGPTILACAVVGTRAELGDDVVVNTGALVEHDCHIRDHAHVATGARLAGGVSVGEGAHVGIGATVRESVLVGAGAIVGAGAVVVADVPPGVVVAGVPARPLRERA